MSVPDPSRSDAGFATLLSGAVSDVQALVRGELELAKAEISRSAKRGATGGGLVAVAVFLLLFALLMFAFAAAYGLVAAGLEPWAAFLVVGGVMLLITAILGAIAVRQFKKIQGPVEAQAEMAKTAQAFADRRGASATTTADRASAAGGEAGSATVFPSYGGQPPSP